MLTKQGTTSTPIAASVSYDSATRKASLNPSADLESGATYTATIKGGSEGVKDSAGNALAADKSWSFTTFTTTATCTITGTSSSETLTGTSAGDIICAGAGDDIIKGLAGNDILKGEAGNDKLYGGIGDDTLDGGLGTDIANFIESLTGISASLVTNTATGEGSDTLVGIENLVGSNLADELSGSDGNNLLTGNAGADVLTGLGGADNMLGHGGNDTLDSRDGVNGNDSVDGNVGTDTCTTDATEKSILNCEQ
jgi:Ca2+-binding RTX toxin-like protein